MVSKHSAIHIVAESDDLVGMIVLPPPLDDLFKPKGFSFDRSTLGSDALKATLFPKAVFRHGRVESGGIQGDPIPLPLSYGDDITYLALPYWLIFAGHCALWSLMFAMMMKRREKRAGVRPHELTEASPTR